MADLLKIEYTTGLTGSGKSYTRVARQIVEDWLPYKSGTFFTTVNLGRVPENHTFPPVPWVDAQGRTRKHESFLRRMCIEGARRANMETGWRGWLGVQKPKEKQITPQDICGRIRRISPILLKDMKAGKVSIVDFFLAGTNSGEYDADGKPIKRTYTLSTGQVMRHGFAHRIPHGKIQFDEVHNFFPKNEGTFSKSSIEAQVRQENGGRVPEGFKFPMSGDQRASYLQQVLGEIRHLKGSIEFMTQHQTKVHRTIKAAAHVRYLLTKIDEIEHDDLFGIKLGDWMQLVASWTGKYHSRVRLQHIADTGEKEEEIKAARRNYALTPDFFRFYDSYEKPVFMEDGVELGQAPEEIPEWKRLSRFEMIFWFLGRNGSAILWSKLTRVCLLLALLISCVLAFQAYNRHKVKKIQAEREAKQAEVVQQSTESAAPVAVPRSVQVRQQHDDSGRAHQIELQLEREREAKEKAQAEARLLRERMAKASSVVLLTPDEVVFRSGERVGIGDEIWFGDNKGATVEAVDMERRAVHLDNGERLWLGRVLVPEREASQDDASDISGDVPASGARAVGSSGNSEE